MSLNSNFRPSIVLLELLPRPLEGHTLNFGAKLHNQDWFIVEIESSNGLKDLIH
jgi:hypothetical protein